MFLSLILKFIALASIASCLTTTSRQYDHSIASHPIMKNPTDQKPSIHQLELNTLATLKPKSNHLVPSKKIVASFVNRNPSSVSFADFVLHTARPTVHLDRFASQIRFMTCSMHNQISILFSDSVFALQAYEIWNNHTDLSLLMGHERQCLGVLGGMAATNITAIRLVGRTMHLTTTGNVKADQLIHGYDLDFHQHRPDANPQHHPPPTNTMNFNYDPHTNQVIASEIKLLSDSFGIKNVFSNISCFNCYTNGSAYINLQVKSRFLVIQDVSLIVDGFMIANLDIGINATVRHARTGFNATLFELPITPFHIPGLFELGPSFVVKTNIGWSAKELIQLGFGFDVSIPININYNSAKLPSTASKAPSRMTFKPHKFMHDVALPVQGLSLGLSPSLGLSLKVLESQVFDLSFSFSNSINLDGVPERLAKCPADLFFYHAHALNFDATTLIRAIPYHHTFWYSGKLPLPLPWKPCGGGGGGN